MLEQLIEALDLAVGDAEEETPTAEQLAAFALIEKQLRDPSFSQEAFRNFIATEPYRTLIELYPKHMADIAKSSLKSVFGREALPGIGMADILDVCGTLTEDELELLAPIQSIKKAMKENNQQYLTEARDNIAKAAKKKEQNRLAEFKQMAADLREALIVLSVDELNAIAPAEEVFDSLLNGNMDHVRSLIEKLKQATTEKKLTVS